MNPKAVLCERGNITKSKERQRTTDVTFTELVPPTKKQIQRLAITSDLLQTDRELSEIQNSYGSIYHNYRSIKSATDILEVFSETIMLSA